MEETKHNNEFDVQVKEERRPIVDNRKQIMQELGIKDDHPHFIAMNEQIQKLSFDMQAFFYPKIKEECDIFDEEFREFSKSFRLKQRLDQLKLNRVRKSH